MSKLFHPLLFMLTNVAHNELAAQIQYLKVENQILRSKLPKRVKITPLERARLVKFGLKVGSAIGELITIVSPRTFVRWVGGGPSKSKPSTRPRKPGRPRTPEEIRGIILRIAHETGWGYTRILGELKKLRIRGVSRTTVRNILIQTNLDPGPKRGEGSWDEFLKIHAKTLWASDFISKKIWTQNGLIDFFILFVINIETRLVHVAAITTNPDGDWMAQQARNLCIH